MNIEFLQPVEITHKLVRKTAWVQQEGWHSYWESQKLPKPITGNVVGKRQVKNGYKEQEVVGDSLAVFKTTMSMTVYLVVFSMGRNPVKVLPEHIINW